MRLALVASASLLAIAVLACASNYDSEPETSPPLPDRDAGKTGTNPGVDGEAPDRTTPPEPGKPLTVTGKIVSYGVGLANIPVVVNGKPAGNTSTLGTFTVADVMPPYDVAFAIKTTDAQPRVTVYSGLTRPDPTLVALGSGGELRPSSTSATSVSGTITGAGGPGWAQTPLVAFGGPARTSGFALAKVADGTYEMKGTADGAQWYGTASVTGTLHAVLVLGTAGAETAFYGKLPGVKLNAGETVTGKDIALAPVDLAQLKMTVTAPAVFDDPTKTVVNMGIRFEDTGGYFLRSTNPGPFPATVTRPVPRVAGTFQVNVGYTPAADAESSYARVTAPSTTTTDLQLALAAAPRPLEPADAAKGVARTTEFTFDRFEGGIQRVTFSAAGQPSVVIVTTATSVKLPDLAPFAASMPADVDYTWRVAGFRPLASLDDDGLALLLAAADGGLPSVERCEVAMSATRKFTLAR